jgi:hypothetical protein
MSIALNLRTTMDETVVRSFASNVAPL